MKPVKITYLLLAFLTAVLIIIKSIGYLNPNFTKGFLSDKEKIFFLYRPFLYAHMFFAPIALITGLFQFSFRKSKIHRVVGKIYVTSILGFAAPSALFMAFFAIGGITSVINFILLSILWFWFTLKAFQLIRIGNIDEHKTFMTRSFILTNSAVLLRIFSYFNHHFNFVDVITGYNIIVWISWLPGLLIFEMINRSKIKVVRSI